MDQAEFEAVYREIFPFWKELSQADQIGRASCRERV